MPSIEIRGKKLSLDDIIMVVLIASGIILGHFFFQRMID
jgi:hypothetical protein